LETLPKQTALVPAFHCCHAFCVNCSGCILHGDPRFCAGHEILGPGCYGAIPIYVLRAASLHVHRNQQNHLTDAETALPATSNTANAEDRRFPYLALPKTFLVTNIYFKSIRRHFGPPKVLQSRRKHFRYPIRRCGGRGPSDTESANLQARRPSLSICFVPKNGYRKPLVHASPARGISVVVSEVAETVLDRIRQLRLISLRASSRLSSPPCSGEHDK
jgi:hypothetical protein